MESNINNVSIVLALGYVDTQGIVNYATALLRMRMCEPHNVIASIVCFVLS